MKRIFFFGNRIHLNKLLTLVMLLLINAVQFTCAQQQCGNFQYLNTTTNECININTTSDFGILFNQTSYTVVVDHTLALTGIPLVPFTVYFSESVTTLSLFRSWSLSLEGIGGVSTLLFGLQPTHPFPANFEPPLVGSDAITAATGDNAPEPGNYRYMLRVVVVFSPVNVAIEPVEVNITLTETPNPCADTPCINGGTCSSSGSQFTCICPPEYTGQVCNVTVNPCDSDPCENGGTCFEILGNAVCICLSGYTGAMCEINIDACDPNPCKNGATCSDGDQGLDFTCSCVNGYAGSTCQIDLNFCLSGYCKNGGTCVEGPGTEISCNCTVEYTGDTCACTAGWGGTNCNIDLPVCTPTSCQNGGTCVEGLGPEFSCSCPPGFTGNICQTVVCGASEPCLNGGTCVKISGAQFICICSHGYTGKICETNICDGNQIDVSIFKAQIITKQC